VRNRLIYSAAAGGAMVLGALAYAGGGTAVATSSATDDRQAVHVAGRLNTLNNSGASGHAEVHARHRHLRVGVDVRNVVKGAPHAMHIHYGKTARNECPTVGQDDTNGKGDFRIETVEGVPAYGPVRVSLTTRGNTGAKSVLAVTRFPAAPKGMIHYDRDVKTGSKVARGIRQGEAVVVVHGVDYNGNGKYDFRGGGKSDLDPSLPAEATDPAACGVLHR
jgi:hypothetical protein